MSRLFPEDFDREHAAEVPVTVLQRIERQASATPDVVAAVFQKRRVTYRELLHTANLIAQALRSNGVGTGSLAGVFLNRSPEMLACLLAVWKVGAAYLPLDPGYPSERIAFMLEDSCAPIVVTETGLLGLLPDTGAQLLNLRTISSQDTASPGNGRAQPPSPESLAYVMYTSGSTGRPKGVKIGHGGLDNTVEAIGRQLRLQPSDVVLAHTTIAFDISNLELYLPLISGGCAHIAEGGCSGDGARMIEVLRDSGAAVMLGTPTTYRLLLEAGWRGSRNLQLIVGGEALPVDLARVLAGRARALWNQYGPTEAGICATTEKITAEVTKTTLGRPIANVQVRILDANLQPAAGGAAGEIYIGGAGVGLGYLNRPELTRACFLPDPFAGRPGATMYKTGDLGARLPDGRIDFLGRIDSQAKVRGFRVEVEEVEAALLASGGVRAAVVRAIEFEPGDTRLVAFVVGDAAGERMRRALQKRLPHFLIPSEYIKLDSLPLTPNGKVDRNALDAVRRTKAIASPSAPLAADDVEAQLAATWRRLLKIDRVDPNCNFFDLGGHSLLAARMVTQIERQFGIKIPISILVERPTIEGLAAYIRRPSEAWPPGLVKIQPGGNRPPLFIAHGLGGSLLSFRDLAEELGPDQPVYGFQLPASLGPDPGQNLIRDLAAKYIAEIRSVSPQGPYHLAGHSSGGLIAFEMACQLSRMGLEVGLLALLDSDFHVGRISPQRLSAWARLRASIARGLAEFRLISKMGVKELIRRRIVYQRLKLQTWLLRRFPGLSRRRGGLLPAEGYLALAVREYVPRPYSGDAVLFAAENEQGAQSDGLLGWKQNILGRLEMVETPGAHQTILTRPHVEALAQGITQRLWHFS